MPAGTNAKRIFTYMGEEHHSTAQRTHIVQVLTHGKTANGENLESIEGARSCGAGNHGADNQEGAAIH